MVRVECVVVDVQNSEKFVEQKQKISFVAQQVVRIDGKKIKR